MALSDRLLRLLTPVDRFPVRRSRSAPVDVAALRAAGVDLPDGARVSLLFPDLLLLPPAHPGGLPRLAPPPSA